MLTLDDLPEPDDFAGVEAFARGFNGFAQFDGFEGASEIALGGKRETVEDMRNELFMFMRAANHMGTDFRDGLFDLYQEMYPKFAEILRKE